MALPSTPAIEYPSQRPSCSAFNTLTDGLKRMSRACGYVFMCLSAHVYVFVCLHPSVFFKTMAVVCLYTSSLFPPSMFKGWTNVKKRHVCRCARTHVQYCLQLMIVYQSTARSSTTTAENTFSCSIRHFTSHTSPSPSHNPLDNQE